MIDNLVSLLSSSGLLPYEEIEKGRKAMFVKSLRKNDFLLSEGKTCDWIAFVNSGILRNFYYSSDGEEITYCITPANQFISAYSSFIQNKPSFENIQAITDVDIIMIRKSDFKILVDSSKSWLEFSNHFAEQSYVQMEERLLSLQMETAEVRYKKLQEKHPELIDAVPLKYIATYLGITPRHLSRLRKKHSE